MKKAPSTTLIAGVLGLSAILACPQTNGQAYCALRDPVSQIYTVCPEASSYRSLVRTIDEGSRDTITSRVPYPMHFTELGRHTLYVGLDGRRPVGLIQARSERSRWGLVEVVWSFDLDLRVTAFSLQRCRAGSADRKEVQSEAFQSLVQGRSFDELVQLLSKDGKSLAPEAAALINGKPGLAVAILRCGIKTAAATEAAWGDDVASARLWQQALTYFPETADLALLARPDLPEVFDRADKTPLSVGSAVRPDGVRMFAARDAAGDQLGVLVRTDCDFGQENMAVWWGVNAQGGLSGAHAERGGDPLVVKALEALRGMRIDEINSEAECANPLNLVAAEVLVNATSYLGGE